MGGEWACCCAAVAPLGASLLAAVCIQQLQRRAGAPPHLHLHAQRGQRHPRLQRLRHGVRQLHAVLQALPQPLQRPQPLVARGQRGRRLARLQSAGARGRRRRCSRGAAHVPGERKAAAGPLLRMQQAWSSGIAQRASTLVAPAAAPEPRPAAPMPQPPHLASSGTSAYASSSFSSRCSSCGSCSQPSRHGSTTDSCRLGGSGTPHLREGAAGRGARRPQRAAQAQLAVGLGPAGATQRSAPLGPAPTC
jgi:hypothetical protein